MAQYFFSSFTQAQAQTFNAQVDSILFNTSEVGSDFRVSINTLLAQYAVTTTTGKSFNFGPGVLGATFTMADGSVAKIGTSQGDNLSGTSGADGLFGGDGADTLNGGDGNDVLNGGAGGDALFGGAGANHFIFDVGLSSLAAPDSIDWNRDDILEFTGMAGKSGRYEEMSANTVADATAMADNEIAAGRADYVAVEVGSRVLLFVSDRGDGHADDLVQINTSPVQGSPLSQISPANIMGAADAATAPVKGTTIVEPSFTPIVVSGGSGANGAVIGNMDAAHVGHLLGAGIMAATGDHLSLLGGPPAVSLDLQGAGFAYDLDEQLVGGQVSRIDFSDTTPSGPFHTIVSLSPSVSAAPFGGWVLSDSTQLAFSTILSGSDHLNGSPGPDLVRGFDGNDRLDGGGGNDTIYGGAGDDNIYASAEISTFTSTTYLRGEDGGDVIVGGGGFDDINGNQGNDSLSGGLGDDWVVGGKDNDLQVGDDGNDIVWGNLGSDTLEGGAGNDQVRGGQGDDLLFGDAGNDYISGDRGNDTEVGGSGADNFHSFSGAGTDRVLDFNASEGDRVMLDPGTTYTASQVGADTVVDMGNGDQLILVGVQLSSLPTGWIFAG